jgi:hypothetical protein
MKPAVVMPEMIRCPDDPFDATGRLHTILGCGRMVPFIRSSDGFIDCPLCGMFWMPELERDYKKGDQ